MENIQRDNLIDQLKFIIAEVKKRPSDAYFAVPEIAVVEIDKGWQQQVFKSNMARMEKAKKRNRKTR